MRPASWEDDAFQSLCGLIGCELKGAAPPEITDTSALVPMARRHRLLDILGRVPGASPDVKAALQSQVRAGLRQVAALAAIIRAAQKRGLPVIVVKGVALSMLLHGDPCRRAAGDIDLLVPPGRFMAAAELLMELGYTLDPDGPPLSAMEGGNQHIRDLTFIGHGQRIELHRRLYELSTRLPGDFDILWSHRSDLTVGPVTIPTIGPVHLALYLLVHGHGHDWERLRWLLDLALLLRQPGLMEMLQQQARQYRVERAHGQALALIGHLFGPLPAFPVAGAVPARPVRMMMVYGMGMEPSPKTTTWFIHRLGHKWRDYRLHDGLGDFLSAMSRDLGTSVGDMALFKLPPGLAWLYPFLRPVGFLWRNFRPGRRERHPP
ncbi:nucleotidyltransferase family protein [Niveispirillum sp. KHB5.9]|uniref:nucleotidyltransferase family protein n=1 Tax=Niveispirillum sp. KHB5.9 TaxID=3400269 RepID=UPI003A84EFCF